MTALDPYTLMSDAPRGWPSAPPNGVPVARWRELTAQANRYLPRKSERDAWAVWGERVLGLVALTLPRRCQETRDRFLLVLRLITWTGVTDTTAVGDLVAQWRVDAVLAQCRLLGANGNGAGHVSRNLSALRHAIYGTSVRQAEMRREPLCVRSALQAAADRAAVDGAVSIMRDIHTIQMWLDAGDCDAYLPSAVAARVRHFARRRGLPAVLLPYLRVERAVTLSSRGVPFTRLPVSENTSGTVIGRVVLARGACSGVSARLDALLDGTMPVQSAGIRDTVGDGMGRGGSDTTPRRPSRAAVRRSMERKRAEFAEPAGPLSERLEAVLASRERMLVVPAEAWPVIGDVVVEVMRRSQFTGEEVFAKRMRTVARLAWWAHQAGYPLTLDVLLAEATIEDWFNRGMPGFDQGTRATYRSQMRAVARAVNPLNNAPVPVGRVPHRDVRPPYDVEQAQAVVWLALQDPNRVLRAKTVTAIVLGLGAGLDSRDLLTLGRRHIDDRGVDGIHITVPGSRTRDVVLLRVFEDTLRAQLPHLPARGPFLAANGTTTGKNYIAHLYARLAETDTGLVRVEQARLRATWLVTLMNLPVPLGVLMRAAGLETARTLTDLLPAARAVTAEQVTVFLRGGHA